MIEITGQKLHQEEIFIRSRAVLQAVRGVFAGFRRIYCIISPGNFLQNCISSHLTTLSSLPEDFMFYGRIFFGSDTLLFVILDEKKKKKKRT